MKTLLIVFLRFFLVFISPFSLGGLFLVLLIARSLAVGIINGFIGLILFIVYVGGDNGSVYLLFYTSSSSKMRPICTSLPFSARRSWSWRFFVRQLFANIWILLNPVITGHSCSPFVHRDAQGCRDGRLDHGLHASRVRFKFEVSFSLNFQSLRS